MVLLWAGDARFFTCIMHDLYARALYVDTVSLSHGDSVLFLAKWIVNYATETTRVEIEEEIV